MFTEIIPLFNCGGEEKRNGERGTSQHCKSMKWWGLADFQKGQLTINRDKFPELAPQATSTPSYDADECLRVEDALSPPLRCSHSISSLRSYR